MAEKDIPLTLSQLLADSCQRFPKREAIVDGATTLSYQQLESKVDLLARCLLDLGVLPGDRIVVHLSKCAEEIILMFASARIGAVVVNVNRSWTVQQLQHVVADCQPSLVVCDRNRGSKILSSLPKAEIKVMLLRGDASADERMFSWPSDGTDSKPELPIEKADPGALAALIYTSGSTGFPKGVMLSHRNICLGADSVATFLKHTSEDRILCVLPMSFDAGMSQVTSTFIAGACAVLKSPLMVADLVKTMTAQGITAMSAVPTLWVQLIRLLQESPHEFPALRCVSTTGGAIPAPTLKALPVVFPTTDIVLMYGQTEAFRSTYLPPEQYADKMGAIGFAIPHAEIFVVDPQSGLCEDGDHGELLHRGPLISQGYWNNPQGSSEKICPNRHLSHLIGDEAVLHTGDIVYRDADGCHWFVGRRDALIKTRGFRVSPLEVESVVGKHPGVSEVVVFGLPDDEAGQLIHLAVAESSAGDAPKQELLAICRAELPRYMMPSEIHHWRGPLPKTSHGKLDRRRIRKEIAEPLKEASGDKI